MFVEVQTKNGPRKVRVCDYCKTVCIPSGRFCSGHCARSAAEMKLATHPDGAVKGVPHNPEIYEVG